MGYVLFSNKGSPVSRESQNKKLSGVPETRDSESLDRIAYSFGLLFFFSLPFFILSCRK